MAACHIDASGVRAGRARRTAGLRWQPAAAPPSCSCRGHSPSRPAGGSSRTRMLPGCRSLHRGEEGRGRPQHQAPARWHRSPCRAQRVQQSCHTWQPGSRRQRQRHRWHCSASASTTPPAPAPQPQRQFQPHSTPAPSTRPTCGSGCPPASSAAWCLSRWKPAGGCVGCLQQRWVGGQGRAWARGGADAVLGGAPQPSSSSGTRPALSSRTWMLGTHTPTHKHTTTPPSPPTVLRQARRDVLPRLLPPPPPPPHHQHHPSPPITHTTTTHRPVPGRRRCGPPPRSSPPARRQTPGGTAARGTPQRGCGESCS